MTADHSRREIGTVIVACLAGAGAVLLAGGLTWGRVTLVVGEAIPTIPVELSGRESAPLAVALGVLGLAAAAALVATRGVVRRGVGGLLLAAGVAVVIDAVRAADRFASLAVDTAPGAVPDEISATGWWWLAVAGGILLCGAGALTTLHGGQWRAMSRRYEAPGVDLGPARPGEATSVSDSDAAWRALDRGEDPTV